MNGTECSKCRQWYLKNNDKYCGYCGSSLISVDIEPSGEIILISQIAPRKKVKFNNTGNADAHIRLECIGTATDLIRFSPDDFTVRAGMQDEIDIILDEDKLPDDFTEQEFIFRCIVNNENPKDKNLSVKVKTGPKPVLLTEEIDFGEIKKGDIPAKRTLELGNKGATPLTLKDVRAAGGNHLQVEKDFKFPIKISANKGIKIQVLWDSNLYNSETGSEQAGFHIIYGNYDKPDFISAKGKALTFDVTQDDIQKNILELLFDLKGTSGGLAGNVRAKIGEWESEPKKLCFPASMNQLFETP